MENIEFKWKWSEKLIEPMKEAIVSDISKNFPSLIGTVGKDHICLIKDECVKCGKDSEMYFREEGFFCYSCKDVNELERK